MENTATNIDYSVQAKAALEAVERLSEAIENVPQKTNQCREKWRDYGAALLKQRATTLNDQKFGHWIKANGLDTGRAATRGVRADAMWLNENWTSVHGVYTGNHHHPTHIRQECRDVGFDWAGKTKRTKAREDKSRRTRAKPYSWMRVAGDEGLSVEFSGARRTEFKKQLVEIDSDPNLFKKAGETRLRVAITTLLSRTQPDKAKDDIDAARKIVNESARQRFDRAVTKATASLEGAYQAKMAELQTSFESQVHVEVEKRVTPELAKERAKAEEAFNRNQRTMQQFAARRDGIKKAMTKDELRLILNCLHPDRAPKDRQKRFAEAFNIVRRLKSYVETA